MAPATFIPNLLLHLQGAWQTGLRFAVGLLTTGSTTQRNRKGENVSQHISPAHRLLTI